MPCYPTDEGHGRRGFICVGNDPVSVAYNGREYYFEWTPASGWVPCTKDGDERLTPVPEAVWKLIEAKGAGGV